MSSQPLSQDAGELQGTAMASGMMVEYGPRVAPIEKMVGVAPLTNCCRMAAIKAVRSLDILCDRTPSEMRGPSFRIRIG
jgi:hypothetical protein